MTLVMRAGREVPAVLPTRLLFEGPVEWHWRDDGLVRQPPALAENGRS